MKLYLSVNNMIMVMEELIRINHFFPQIPWCFSINGLSLILCSVIFQPPIISFLIIYT